MSNAALVVGGSAAGVQAALDLAESQIQVYIVERSATLGPTDLTESNGGGPAHGLLLPRLLAAVRHPNIQILANSEVVDVQGHAGDISVTVQRHPRYVLEDRCTGCARCERACPVALRNGDDTTRKAIGAPHPRAVPYTFSVDKNGTSPCRLACPGGINAHGYVALTAQGRFPEALDLILEAVPFPGVLGRVCTRPCEAGCNRREYDDPIAICSLKRFVADESWDQVLATRKATAQEAITRTGLGADGSVLSEDLPANRRKVAIVGSGPAGLSAAWRLATMGYAITIFESLPVAGGMLATCIPEFRLPREVVRREIAYITSLGVDIRTSVTVGRDVSLEQLREQKYEAVFLAIGAHRSRSLGVPGDSLPGVVDCISLLKGVSLGARPDLGRTVLVIGGGNAALDAARTAVRLGVERVKILYRRSRGDMPANPEEIKEAEREGVEIVPLVAPTRVLGQDRVSGIECLRCEITGTDAEGRGRSRAMPGSEHLFEADSIVLAIGQETDFSLLPATLHPVAGSKVVATDGMSLATSLPGIFAGGDAVVGASTVIEAIASGKRAAESIDRYLRGEEWTRVTIAEKQSAVIDIAGIRHPRASRQGMPSIAEGDRVSGFDEVELGFTADMAIREAQRCLNCAGCSECMRCVEACELRALAHEEQTQTLDLRVGAVIYAPASEATEQVEEVPSGVWPFVLGSAAAARAMATLSPGPPARSITDGVPSAITIAPPGEPLVESSGASVDSSRFIVEFGAPMAKPSSGVASNGSHRVGVFLCECGGQVSARVNFEEVLRASETLPDVVHRQTVRYACSSSFKQLIKEECASRALSTAIIASCACCSIDQICYACTHTKVRCKNGLIDAGQRIPPSVGRTGLTGAHTRYEFVNIREQCAFVHSDSVAAAEKATGLIAAALARTSARNVDFAAAFPVRPVVAIVGHGAAATGAATICAAQGFETHLIAANTGELPPMGERGAHATIFHEGASLMGIAGQVGRYEVSFSRGQSTFNVRAGVVILDGESLGRETLTAIGRGLELDPVGLGGPAWFSPDACTGLVPPETKAPGIFYCPAPSGGSGLKTRRAVADKFGAAAASRAATLIRSGEYKASPLLASVAENRCRWCGECQKACGFGAIRLVARGISGEVARVDLSRCRGCGVCVPRCATGAISLAGGTTGITGRSLEQAISALLQ